MNDLELLRFGDCYFQSVISLRDEYRLSYFEANMLVRCFVLMNNHGPISYNQLKAHFGITSGSAGLPAYAIPFFLVEPNLPGTLSVFGEKVFQWWITSLRRVLHDESEYKRLTVGYITKAEKDKRRLKQRFWALPNEEQVKILRDYFCLPFRNDEEKRIRHDKRIEIFKKYDLRNTDLTNAINRHGLVVKSVRCSAEYRHLFPDYVPGEWGKRRNKPKQDDLP